MKRQAGKPPLSEADVERTVVDLLTSEGWLCFKTDAATVRRGHAVRPAMQAGTLDYLCVRPYFRHSVQALFLEIKGEHARTVSKRKAAQTATTAYLRKRGFVVCHMPDGLEDPIGYFMGWYKGLE